MILVTGSQGQLGSCLGSVLKNQDTFFATKEKLNICDLTSLTRLCNSIKPKLIINCAAFTNVDLAESNILQANNVNVKAVRNLSLVAQELDCVLIHISTDYVFDGVSNIPYKETDPTNPCNVYGETKLNGEMELRRNTTKHIVIRTSWLYSHHGSNFVKSMHRLLKERDCLRVVYDQMGSPTNAMDLASTIKHIASQSDLTGLYGTYHFSNSGVTSWFDLVKHIQNYYNIKCRVEPIESKDYPTPAKRPKYSVLNCDKIKKDFKIKQNYWVDSLEKVLRELG